MDVPSSGNDVVPYRWVILVLATATFLITFFIRFAWPPLIPAVVPVLKMTMSQAGAYMSAFYAGYLVTQIPAGLLADRFGVRLIIALSLIIEGISTYFMGSIGNYETGFVLRIVTGLGAGAVFGACSRAIMEWFPARERGTAFGIMFAAPSGGIVLASLVVTPLNAAIGWQGAFRVSGVIAIVVGIIVYLATRTSDQVKSSEGIFAGFPVVFGSKDLLLTALAGVLPHVGGTGNGNLDRGRSQENGAEPRGGRLRNARVRGRRHHSPLSVGIDLRPYRQS